MKRVPMTPEGYQKIKEELDRLVKVRKAEKY